MNFLLDTHTLLWHLNADNRISELAENIISNPQNKISVSIASIWEISIKISLKKLDFKGGTKKIIDTMNENDFILQNVNPAHIWELEKLPLHHRDPFDRIIVATAIAENWYLISKDENIALYSVKTLW